MIIFSQNYLTMKFIKLQKDGEGTVYIDAEKIVSIIRYSQHHMVGEENYTRVSCAGAGDEHNYCFNVVETPEEILELIKSANQL